MAEIKAFPLQWPDGWKRTAPAQRRSANFSKQSTQYNDWTDSQGQRHSNSYHTRKQLSIADAVGRVRAEVRAMTGDDDFILNSNLEIRLDGLPKSGQREPDDPGVAIYWIDNGEQRCMAIDKYDRIADNIAALAATFAAMRAIERHGSAEILNRAFKGFVAIEDQRDPWWRELGVGPLATRDEVQAAYKRLRSKHHPDREGGSAEQFDRIQKAYDAGMRSFTAEEQP